jgi:O-antigen/teichoic acid export membrane protein
VGSFRSFVRVGQGAVPFAVSDLFTSIYGQADTTIAAMLLDQEAVGLYATASRLISALYVIPSACYSVVLPVLVRVLKEKRASRRISSIAPAALLANVGLFAIVGCALWLSISYASHLLPAFVLGSSFKASGQIMARLSPVLLLKSLSFAAVVVIVAVGWQKRRVYVQAVVALLNLICSLVLVRGLGIEGLAGIQVWSEALLLVGYVGLTVYWVWRRPSHAVQG